MPDSFHRLLKNPRTWQLVLAGYWLALFASTHVPSNVPLLPGEGADKLVHFAAFALLAAILATTWQLAAGQLTVRHLLVLWSVILLYAVLDEWTQSFVGRSTSFADWTADALGALFAIALFVWCRRRMMK